MPLKSKLRAACSLTIQDWRLFFQAWLLLLFIDLALRLAPYKRVHIFLRSSAARKHPAQTNNHRLQPDAPAMLSENIQGIHRIVDLAGRNHLIRMTCLRRSLALQWLLARRGIQSELRFGVRHASPDRLDAHAWLEHAGAPISEPEIVLERYTALLELASAERSNPPKISDNL
jgi:hypothetical protein